MLPHDLNSRGDHLQNIYLAQSIARASDSGGDGSRILYAVENGYCFIFNAIQIIDKSRELFERRLS